MNTPLIPPEYESILRIGVILILIYGFYFIFRPSKKITLEKLSKTVYAPHKFAHFISYSSLLVFVFFAVLPFSFPEVEVGDFLIFMPVSLVFLTLTVLTLLKLKSSRIELLDKELYTKYGRKVNMIPYDEIIDAYYLQGHLHIVTTEKNRKGKPKHKLIPAIFEDMGALIENINRRACGGRCNVP